MNRSSRSWRTPARHLLAAIAALASFVVVIPVGALLLTLWAVSAAARGLARLTTPRTTGWKELVEYAPEVGWKPRPGLDCHAEDLAGDPFHVVTDEEGYRGAHGLSHSEVVVFGDSFAFGYAADDEDLFLRHAGGARVTALAAPGYSMVQPVLWMERLGARLSGKLVVWMVYLGNDLYDSLRPSTDGYRSPAVRLGEDGTGPAIVTAHVREGKIGFPRDRGVDAYVEICSGGLLSSRVFAAAEYLIERGWDACRAAGADLVIVSIPELSAAPRAILERKLALDDGAERFDEGLLDRTLAAICERAGVGFVPLFEHMGPEHYLQVDWHWNRAGHRRVGRVLGDLHALWLDGRLSTGPGGAADLPSEPPPSSDARTSAAAREP
ncbi:MAG: hypothetical protein Q8W51_08385 [Candidatus Palauibacterales bacterium]|nr:hypothetical protein [Candidatus Palauibacterales bacterium]MDP2529742.1 hypothetical protein [Candidatus Palauibacterales bacterium]MDP2583166.1 hypothetical protein [Candidatus Palauibacterales bacterium]